MKIIITEEQKKSLFIPRKQEGEDSKWNTWNKKQPIKDGVRINQYTEDGNKTGYWEEYHDNGQLASKGNFIDGKRDGIWKYYYDNGQLGTKGYINNGKVVGVWKVYSKDGQLFK